MKRALFLLLAGYLTVYSDILVVVSKDSMVETLDKHTVQRIFLNKTRSFPNGERAEAIEGVPSELKQDFYRLVADKSKTQLRSYWAKQVFTGKGKPPKQMNSDDLVIYIAQNPDAISYISVEQLSDSLKVVFKLKQ
ncbi:MAG: hypothetical protein DRG24_09200, partial [Epsilonproteobacteria bacterium]